MMRVDVGNVTKYFGSQLVLDGIDLVVADSEVVAVIGPSGCGKSTLFNLIAGLDSPTTGSVAAEPAAYMPQRDLLFPWRTVLDNTTLGLEVQGVGKRDARARASALFDVFGLSGYESARPHQLSGGMRQRAAMLRTVVQGRDLLLLDEPFGALDAITRTTMQMWLQDIRARYGWTVLMITHDVREAVFLADRVVVLSRRPARVEHVVTVDLPRPRDLSTLTSPEFAAIERQLLTFLHEPSKSTFCRHNSGQSSAVTPELCPLCVANRSGS